MDHFQPMTSSSLGNVRAKMMSCFLSSVKPGECSASFWVGVSRRDSETLNHRGTYPQRVPPPGCEVFYEVFAFNLNQLGTASNALFCELEVWQDFIHLAVPRFLSCGTNFFCNKHQTQNKHTHIHKHTQNEIVKFVIVPVVLSISWLRQQL